MMTNTQKPTYRADIDGLRAIAVLGVLLYHAGDHFLPGGFVGVDVFFVISGFLIAGLIERSIADHTFSLIEFYERRIRRIFPALFGVLIAVIAVSAFLLDPPTYEDLAKSLLATATSTSNLYFYNTINYFNPPSTIKPLLHTWSLSVEEQFYLVLPLLLLLLSRLRPALKNTVLLALACVSLAFSQYSLGKDASAAFYLAHLRAWELLAGALIVAYRPQIRQPALNQLLSFLGLALILGAMLLLNDSSPFPGLNALYPVVGSVLLIIAGSQQNGYPQKLLSLPPMRFVGNISYSLYLWHWPIFIIGAYVLITPPSLSQWLLLFIASFVMATLSWRYIETPFRHTGTLSRKHVFSSFALGSLLLLIAAGYVAQQRGLKQRFDSFNLPVEISKTFEETYTKCAYDPKAAQATPCIFPSDATAAKYFLWGDSFSMAIMPAFEQISQTRSIPIKFMHNSGCRPYVLDDRFGNSAECAAANQAILSAITNDPNVKVVILAGRWNYKADRKVEELYFADLFKKLADAKKKVVVIDSPPQYNINLSKAYFVSLITHRDLRSILHLSTADHRSALRPEALMFQNLMKSNKNFIKTIDLTPSFCDDNGCIFLDEQDQLLYEDAAHLSLPGALRTVPLLSKNIFDK